MLNRFSVSYMEQERKNKNKQRTTISANSNLTVLNQNNGAILTDDIVQNMSNFGIKEYIT